jgi:hypothetical protein
MKMRNALLALTVLSTVTPPIQAVESASREALERMFVTREAEWAAQACTHKIVETDLLWDDFIARRG